MFIVVRFLTLWMGSEGTRRNPKRSWRSSWDAALFVFSNDVSILLLLLGKCKTVFSVFCAAVPVSWVQPYFLRQHSLSAPTPDGPQPSEKRNLKKVPDYHES